jgi:AraC family transcriptional regulator, carnitine catabolism transcriptional activator
MQIWTNTVDKPIKISFLLFDQFSNHCLANCLEPFRACNSFTTTPVFDWQFLTISGQPVQSSSGLPILPEGALSASTRCDYLFVMSSYEYLAHDTPTTRMALQKAAKLSGAVAGLDTGAWLMAAAGLLQDKQATIHWDVLGEFSETFPKVYARRLRMVHDINRLTCAGAMSAFDLSLSIISKHLGQSFKVDIEAFFIHQDNPDIPRNTRDPLLGKALEIMHANIENPLSRITLAKRLSGHAKTLDRRSEAEFGVPLAHVYRHIRLSAAQQMVISTSLSILDISLRSGFQNPSAMTRAYKARFGLTPTQNRQALSLR